MYSDSISILDVRTPNKFKYAFSSTNVNSQRLRVHLCFRASSMALARRFANSLVASRDCSYLAKLR
jgi:hypothetical protein